MPAYATVLFDLDGTLIDSISLIMSSFRHTMRTHLGRVPPDAEWRAGFGIPLRPQLARFAGEPSQVADMAATYRAHNREHHDRLVKPYPGVQEMVSGLTERGVKLGIVTSKNRAGTQHGLRHCELDRFFEVVVTSDDVTEHKPRPAPVLEAVRRLDASADVTVFIGDSPYDCQAGKAAGVSTASALWGPFSRETLEPHAPNHWLEYPEQVLELECVLPGEAGGG
ncbi:MAG: HAD-IA family hydrolase [Vicinamibacterales bacterium]|jgi:pyrophosphatase PpaX|nr:HAD-IA family hydrolase [Vicinamibacterales bacterium]